MSLLIPQSAIRNPQLDWVVAKSHADDNTFGRQFRLRGRSPFLGVMLGKDSQRRKGRWCEMIIGEPKDMGRPATRMAGKPATKTAGKSPEPRTQFGITVTRKAGGAVRRNRLKRIVREYLRTHKRHWPENKLVVIRISGPVTDEADLLAEIEDMLKSAR